MAIAFFSKRRSKADQVILLLSDQVKALQGFKDGLENRYQRIKESCERGEKPDLRDCFSGGGLDGDIRILQHFICRMTRTIEEYQKGV
jgi:hypothetical protein